MAPSSVAASDEEDFQDAEDAQEMPKEEPIDTSSVTSEAEAASATTKVKSSPAKGAGAGGTSPAAAGGKKGKKLKGKKSKAGLKAAAAEQQSSPIPVPASPIPDSSSAYSPTESPANTTPAPSSPVVTPTDQQNPIDVDLPAPASLVATNDQRAASPPPLLAPGARIGDGFANAQPFKSTDGGEPAAAIEGNGADASPRGTTTLELHDSPEHRDTLSDLSNASPSIPSLKERPFSLSSEPETPSTSFGSPTSPSSRFTHQSLSSHSHADPDQTTGGGQTSPSIAGMAWRSDRATSTASNTSALAHSDKGKSPASFYGDGDDFEEEDLGDEARDGDPATPTRSNGRSSRPNGHRRTVSEASSIGGPGEGESSKYGFLRQRVEQQNTILEGDPQAKRASVQGMSQIRESFARVREREAAAAKEKAARGEGEEIDWDFWGRVMSNYEEVASTNPRELSRAIQRGIPPALRGMTWQLMAATKDETLEGVYSELLKQTSPHEKSIGRDLNRTFPKHEYFMDAAGVGQENLFNVVKAYSIYDEEVGYTQGLQFIVGPLLLNMPDEEAFCVLVRLMKSYDLRSHYTPNMPGLQLRLFQFDRLLEELLPGVFMHLLRQGIKSSMYASQWFLTLFGYRFPLELVSSVFDLVFAEGVEAIFRFSVAILKRSEEKICQLEFEDLIEFLKNELYEVYAPDPDDPSPHPLYKAQEFVREALQVKITPLMLDQFGEEWANLCAQQSAHTLEIDSLRKANIQLSLQVRQLEASLSQINIEHCDLVKQVVMAKLEREELEDELVKYKIAYADLSHQQASDGASSSRASMQAAADREDRLSKSSSSWMSRVGSSGA